MIGYTAPSPAAPDTASTVSIGSGPYAAEPSPSSPIAGIPASAPILRPSASRLASRRPRNAAVNAVVSPVLAPHLKYPPTARAVRGSPPVHPTALLRPSRPRPLMPRAPTRYEDSINQGRSFWPTDRT